MAALAEHERHVVTLLLPGRDHRPVLEVPVEPGVDRVSIVVHPVLDEDADRPAPRLADEFGIHVAALEVREAADEADHLAELIGPLPGDGEGADGPAAGAADGPSLRILGQV